MPVTVNKEINGLNAQVSAIKALQTFLGRPVKVAIDAQFISREIILLQTYLQTQGKFSAGNINRGAIDDQQLSREIIDLQNAANLP